MNRDRRLPTRVGTACDRCRQRKQRCDDQSPCSNCVYMGAECVVTRRQPSRRTKVTSALTRPEVISTPSLEVIPQTANASPSPQAVMSTDRATPSHNEIPRNMSRSWTTTPLPQTLTGASPMSATSSNTRVPPISELDESSSAVSITRQIFDNENRHSNLPLETSAIPGADSPDVRINNGDGNHRAHVAQVLGAELPPVHICDALLHAYFQKVHWFSLVVFEPKFRARYNQIIASRTAHTSDVGFLLLLATILIMGAWYSDDAPIIDEHNAQYDTIAMRNKYLTLVRSRFLDLMDEDSLEFVQLCTLLGSFYLYHSKPRASFSMLGAATKTAQAMRLHIESNKRLAFEDEEQRKRVWWTIYTWDRFATIIYGRPLSINDRDCSVSMPASFEEDSSFNLNIGSSRFCLSTYQTCLNRIYQIASPVLENLYRIRTHQDEHDRLEMSNMVAEVDQLMQAWLHELPSVLAYTDREDIDHNSSEEYKTHSLQALALQLTYDNLVMIINRPLLFDHLQVVPSSTSTTPPRENDTIPVPGLQSIANQKRRAFKRCLDSALNTSKVQRKKNLVCLARQTHLVSFLGINLFTASVVMFICARSNILSNLAQEAKRGMARVLSLQKLLSPHNSLSMQCSAILENLVQIVLEKEKEEMLAPITSQYGHPSPLDHRPVYDRSSFSREDIPAGHNGSMDYSFAGPEYDMDFGNLLGSGEQFRESLINLQQVVQDNVSEAQTLATNPVAENAEIQQEPIINNWPYTGYASHVNPAVEQGRLEDLGQFWLWEM